MSLQHILKNSSVSGKEPLASQLANGELSINYHADGPFLCCKDTAGNVRRVAGVWVSATAPSTPFPGELWLDIGITPSQLKVYKDTTDAWVFAGEVNTATTTTEGVVRLATNAEAQGGTSTTSAVTPAALQSKISDSTSTTSSTTIASSTAVKAVADTVNAALPKSGGTITGIMEIGNTGQLRFEGSSADAYETTLAVEDPTATRTITLPDRSGTVITTGDTGTVTSTMIADGAIVNADINANAEIAVSKLADGSARQLLQTDAAGTGVEWTSNVNIPGTLDVTGAMALDSTLSVPAGSAAAPSINFAGDNTGIYSPGANQLAVSTGGTGRLFVDSSGRLGLGTSSPSETFHVNGNARLDSKVGIGDIGSATKLRITGDIPDDGEAFAVGVIVSATASASTNAIYGFISDVKPTSTSANTVTHIYRYHARQLDSFGSATVTNQYGFLAANDLTGATNNFGFHSGLADASGRWNFYAAGSAPNYFAGNVGIGTSSPVNKLHVSGETRFQNNGVAVTLNNNTESYAFIGDDSGSLFINAGGTADTLLLRTNGVTRLGIDPSGTTTLTSATSTTPFIVIIGTSEVARIDGGGRLLMGKSTVNSVGNTTPLVQVDGPDGRASIAITRRSNDVSQSLLILAKTRSTDSSAVAVQEGDNIGEVRWSADDGVDLNSIAACVRTKIDGAVAGNDLPGRLEFLTTNSGNATFTERFRITSDGVRAYNQSAPAAVNTTATLTVANLKTGIITSTTAAAVTMTLPTGSDTEAGFSGIYTSMTFEWSVINTGATNAVTVQGGTGHTLTGSGTVAASTSGRFASRRTAANTFVTYRLS